MLLPHHFSSISVHSLYKLTRYRIESLSLSTFVKMAPQAINWAIYNSLPPDEGQYQLAHVHDSRKISIAATYIVCVPISLLSVIMRFVSRRIGRTLYGADDWIMVMGTV